MSLGTVTKICDRILLEPGLRDAIETDPKAAPRSARSDPSEEELTALVAGDVGVLSTEGANHLLLHQRARFRLLDLYLRTCGARAREACCDAA